ncbi:MAG: family 10 glycosylhydrolase, partial [Fidelibacterota bacterium]
LESNDLRWLNLFHPEVRQSIVDFFGYLISEYEVDGIMGGGHLFSQPLQGVYSDSIRRYFFQQEYGELLAEQYGESDWQRWYREETNRNIRKIYKELKNKYPAALIYWLADASRESTTGIVQDWTNWLNGGYADLVIPVINAADIKSYERVLSSLHPDSIALFRNKERIVPGVVLNSGISMSMTSFVLRVVESNRRSGYKGEVFFGFENLYGEDNSVIRTLRKTHYLRPAAFWQAPLY